MGGDGTSSVSEGRHQSGILLLVEYRCTMPSRAQVIAALRNPIVVGADSVIGTGHSGATVTY
jgi:hypothetical protein